MNWRSVMAAVVLVALAGWAVSSSVRLQRQANAYRIAAAEGALPRLAAGSGQLVAPTPERALGALSRRIGDAGAGAGVRLSLIPLGHVDGIPGVATLRVVARGDEARLLRFSADVEQGPVVIRWSRWSILPDGAGGLRLTADAVAPWRAR